MALYQVLLDIPGEIERGLSSGALVRNAAGVIRHAVGPHRGEIVAHLREASGFNPLAMHPQSIVPPVASIGLQTTTLVYLKVRLDRIERLTGEVLSVAREALATVTRIEQVQYVAFTKMIGRGLEYLERSVGSQNREGLAEAQKCFVYGLADLRTLLATHNGESMLEHAPNVRVLLRAAALGAVAEMRAMSFAQVERRGQLTALGAHRSFWAALVDCLAGVPGPSERLPTLQMLEANPEGGPEATRRRWLNEAQSFVDMIDGEARLLELSDDQTNADVIREWVESEPTAARLLFIPVAA